MEISDQKYNELIRDQKRYAYVRRLSAGDYGNLIQKNIRTGIFFDTLIDQEIEKQNEKFSQRLIN